MKVSAITNNNQSNFTGGLKLKPAKNGMKSPLNLAYAAIVPLMTLIPATNNAANDVYEKAPANQTTIIKAGDMSEGKKTGYIIVGLFSALATYCLTGAKKAT